MAGYMAGVQIHQTRVLAFTCLVRLKADTEAGEVGGWQNTGGWISPGLVHQSCFISCSHPLIPSVHLHPLYSSRSLFACDNPINFVLKTKLDYARISAQWFFTFVDGTVFAPSIYSS